MQHHARAVDATAELARSSRSNTDLVFGPNATEAFFASTMLPGGEEEAANRLNAFLEPPKPAVARPPQNTKSPVNTGDSQHRYRDSNPGKRTATRWS